jgi:hypothetical protein
MIRCPFLLPRKACLGYHQPKFSQQPADLIHLCRAIRHNERSRPMHHQHRLTNRNIFEITDIGDLTFLIALT